LSSPASSARRASFCGSRGAGIVTAVLMSFIERPTSPSSVRSLKRLVPSIISLRKVSQRSRAFAASHWVSGVM
jgi:hypothetical protein